MLLPLMEKDPTRSDFDCRDGEIDFILRLDTDEDSSSGGEADVGAGSHSGSYASVSLVAEGTSPTATLRVPLQSGDRQKAELMLSGQAERVDPSSAERIAQAIVERAAQCLLDISTDLRRQGLFILPFRFFTMQTLSDGSFSYPSPQGLALPTPYPPHPEITAASATDDCLTLAIRFPVRPHRLTVSPPASTAEGAFTRTFISYPLYIPDPKEQRGSIGSVRSAAGGNATGVRFAFLSTSAIKASVAAPEKYYELVGNERTGYRISSKAAASPDYSCYASAYGYVPSFPGGSLMALGEGVGGGVDPLDWIADWRKRGEGYLPVALPYAYWSVGEVADDVVWPEGIEADAVLGLAKSIGAGWVMLTRPMCFAESATSRRHAGPTAIGTLRVLGLGPERPALTILYGSDDGVRWTPLRRFDPRRRLPLHTPPRLFWRVLLMSLNCDQGRAEAVFLKGGVLEVGLRPLLLQ